MNRLQAAKQIRRNRLVIDTLAGNRFYENAFNSGEKRSIMTYGVDTDKDWTQLTWKQMLAMLRGYFDRREDAQCDHKYEMWSDSGYRLLGHAKCVVTHNHFHCKACGAAETATGICNIICFECQMKADKERRELTWKILQFEQRYEIPFHEDGDMRDQIEGSCNERGYHGDRGEDFHADG